MVIAKSVSLNRYLISQLKHTFDGVVENSSLLEIASFKDLKLASAIGFVKVFFDCLGFGCCSGRAHYYISSFQEFVGDVRSDVTGHLVIVLCVNTIGYARISLQDTLTPVTR